MNFRITNPVDIPTRETADFVASNLQINSSLIEVGCGEGNVAAALCSRGYQVLGVDSDQEAIESAREKGVEAVQACWPNVDIETVDAIAFTRSLHHIGDLQPAIDKAADSLPSQGLLLLEDFAFNLTNMGTMNWFLGLLNAEEASSQIKPVPDEFVTRILSAGNPIEEWEQDKHHDLHSARDMKNAIALRFEIVNETPVPYFYRYLVPVFPETSKAASIVEKVLKDEQRLGESGEIVFVGRRIVAMKR